MPSIHARKGLLNPSKDEVTPWIKLLAQGEEPDFLVTLNVTKDTFEFLCQRVKAKRSNVNYGRPYRKGLKVKGRKPFPNTRDIVGLVLAYRKTHGYMCTLCPYFRMCASSLSSWIDYGMELMYNTVTDPSY